MAVKPIAYAMLEGLAQEMEANPKLHVNFGQASHVASDPSGAALDVSKMFPFPRTITRAIAAIDEGSYAGWASGMAAAGFPAVIRFPSMAQFIAFEYVYNNIAKLRYMTGGQVTQPIVLWFDGSRRSEGSGGQHVEVGSESVYAYLAGLRIGVPSNAYDGKGMLITAIRSGDPIALFQYGDVGSAPPMDVPDEQFEVAFGEAAVRQRGTDLTIVAWAPASLRVANALEDIKAAGISAEFIDPRWLKPLDVPTLAASVRKTGRLLVVEHGNYTQGFGASIVSEVAQEVSGAKFKRLAFPDAPGPHSKEMMRWMIPDEAKIVDAAKQMMEL
jgi:pyruvate dehydrogenase E1 component beta subunit